MSLIGFSEMQRGELTSRFNKPLNSVLGRGVAAEPQNYGFCREGGDDYDGASAHVSWGKRRGPACDYHGLRLLLEHGFENGADAEEGAHAVGFAHRAPFGEGCVCDGGLSCGTDLDALWVVS